MADPETKIQPSLFSAADGVGSEKLRLGEDADLGSRLGRFTLETMLGRGGMGKVYEAWDPKLERQVAVKIMRGGDPVLLKRFIREVRAQAALSHPGICPVYEVGESAGRPYIVMQRLRGEPLDKACDSLALESKLLLVQQVAEAIHEAHRVGLIHRDLKPGNILVETPCEGPLRPFVLDFGLARPLAVVEPDDAAMTEEGAMVGTPAYMAPEQVRGDLGSLDRRTDVWALGATLYRLVAGKPPFPATGPAFVIDVLDHDPPSLRPFGTPAELSCIIFKCLEKDRARRYSSALELAEDIGRFLDGKAVLARPASRRYRLGKWVQRHRSLTAAVALLALVLMTSVAWGIYSAKRADVREQLVSKFVEQVADMEALVRYSHMSPLHDIRPDRELLRARMTDIRGVMEEHGALAVGAGHFALGSGHLALEELDDARRHLEAAWEAGYRTSEAASTLAQILSALYRRQLTDVELVQDWDSRQHQMRELEQRYSSSVKTLLEGVSNGELQQPLLQALMHFHNDRFAAALRYLEEPEVSTPWAYELPRLEGEIRRAWAIKKNAEGDEVGAREELELAQAAFQRAAEVAASDPSIHRASAQVAFQRLILETTHQQPASEVESEGLQAVERALEADPEDGRAWLWKARIHRLVAARLQDRGEDPTAQLEAAIAGATKALAGLDSAPEAWREVARGHWGLARWLEDRGDDPQNRLQEASRALEQVKTQERAYADHHLTAMVHQTLASHRMSRGQDATGDFESAIAAYRSAIENHSTPFGAWINLGSCLLNLSALPSVEEKTLLLEQAVDAFLKAQALRPTHGLPSYYLGRAYLRLAQGGDPGHEVLESTWVSLALEAYRRALKLSPSMFQAYQGLGAAHHLQALDAINRGLEPEAFFAQAREAYGNALEIAPNNALSLSNLAWTDYFQGKLRVRSGRDPEGSLERAIAGSRLALESGSRPDELLCLGSAWRLLAEWRLRSFGDVGSALAAAREAFERVLEMNPQHAEAHRSLGRLLTLEAKWNRDNGQASDQLFNEARSWLDKALVLKPEMPEFWLALARWGDERGEHALALDGVQRALELRPDWLEARVLEKALKSPTEEAFSPRDPR